MNKSLTPSNDLQPGFWIGLAILIIILVVRWYLKTQA